MERKYINKMNMYGAVKDVCNEYSTAWSVVPAFGNVFNLFTQKLQELTALGFEQSRIISGYAVDKQQLRVNAADKADVLLNALKAFAKGSANDILSNELAFSKSTLVHGSHESSKKKIGMILEKAQQFESELVDFGIDGDLIAETEDALELYVNALNAPRVAIARRKVYTRKIKSNILFIDGLLNDQLDKIANIFKENVPDFFLHYQQARVIVDNRGKKGGQPPINFQLRDDG